MAESAVGLRVIGSGVGRTGTHSLKLALEWLGLGPCHHMTDVLADPGRALMWIDAFEGRANWEAIFEGYSSVVDAPGCRFWRELAERYPRARVLHSVRDADEWFDSTQTSVFAPDSRSLNPEPPYDRFFEHNLRPFRDHIHDRLFMTDYFHRHGAEVERTIPKDRLLVYEVGQGWEPLCAFLGVPVPQEPFPLTNTREEYAARTAARNAARTRS